MNQEEKQVILQRLEIMKNNQDIRWIQRYENYQKALLQLKEALELKKERALSRLEKQGTIQAFEFTHELAWNTLKDLLEYRGNTGIFGSRDAFRKAFQLGLITEGQVWMDSIASRNLASHIYDEETAEMILRQIEIDYFPQFEKLDLTLAELAWQE